MFAFSDVAKADMLEDAKQQVTALKANVTSVESKISAAEKTLKDVSDNPNVLVKKSITKLKNNEIESLKSQKVNLESQILATQTLIDKEEDRREEEEQKRKAEEAEKARLEAERIEAERVAAEKAKLETAIQTQQLVAGTTAPSFDYAGATTYPVGQCTWGVKVMAPWVGNYWGNAAEWNESAAAAGFRVGTTPVVGSVLVWEGGYGHVAYVTDVREDGMIQVMEANYGGSAYAADPRGIGNYRGWFHPGGGVSYIYPNN